MINAIFDWLINLTGNIEIVTLLLAVLPMAEARIAIPVAIKYSVPPFKAFLLGFAGSTAAAALLLLFLLPLIRLLTRLKPFKKLGGSVLKTAEEKAEKIKGGNLKKMLGIGAFVSLPLPLTGVWMGSLLAGILDLKYLKAFLCIAAGNLCTSVIITVASIYFAEYINIMVAVLTAVAMIALVIMLIKAFIPARNAYGNRV